MPEPHKRLTLKAGGFLMDAHVFRRDPAQVGIARLGRNHFAHDDMTDVRRVDTGSHQCRTHGTGAELA